MEAGKYQIYGRMAYETPLTFVRELVVEESVRDEALALLGDESWIEVIAIPEEKLIQVIGEREDG